MRLLCDTTREWVALALQRFDEVLVDHAHCEKKAAAHALSLLAAFPMVAGLPRAMARLAREEAGHLAQVLSVMEKRGLPLGRDPGDPMKRFYSRLADAESGHRELFLRLARRCEGFEARLGQMLRAEASLIRELPLRPAIH